jgi:hypothetical protein
MWIKVGESPTAEAMRSRLLFRLYIYYTAFEIWTIRKMNFKK